MKDSLNTIFSPYTKNGNDTIVKMIFGSHLYGTNSENSDTDYKGLYRPSLRDCLLDRIPKSIHTSTGDPFSKNTKDDIDEEMYSLQYFMKLAINGEMIVIDMIHAPDSMIIESNSIWDKLRLHKGMFYSKNLCGYLGYIRKQTAKYGVKGSRINVLKSLLDILKKYVPEQKLSSIWNELPITEYSFFVENPKDDRFKLYECCGKKLQENITIGYAIDIVETTHKRYGDRAHQASMNEGIDWKAVSHAFRAGHQLLEIYTTNDLKFPLKNSEYIRDIKLGKLHYTNDHIQEKLEELLFEVEELSKNSRLPEKINRDKLDKFILDCYHQ
jgi:predicted nucleotidyltransferase